MKSRLCFLVLLLFSFFAYGNEVRILSFDGGGVRGVISLDLLKKIEHETGLQPLSDFEVYAGTSTGSIIAVLLALGKRTDFILQSYEELSSKVFSDENTLHLFKPKYDHKKLKHQLKKLIRSCGHDENILVKDLPKKVVIPTVKLNDPETKNWHLEVIENISENGGNIRVVDAILESTAAPTYFSSEHDHVDGGMGMKDPSLAALLSIFDPLKHDLKDFIILALGTGYSERSIKTNEDWGIAQWMGTGSKASGDSPLLSLVLDVESQIPSNVLTKLLGDRFLKIDFPLRDAISLDDYKNIKILMRDTDEFVSKNPKNWNAVITWVSSHFNAPI
ncbi:MAG: patatin-like phospholipase family protein [Chlamydiia bacterium]|nr:patatin-like phospholipase family protein [Chlamydiia bacterium]